MSWAGFDPPVQWGRVCAPINFLSPQTQARCVAGCPG